MTTEPKATLDTRFSSEDAVPRPWAEVTGVLEGSEVFWLSTVRRDGRPHVTTLLAGWLDDELHFITGGGEQKAKNLEVNPNCVLTTGTTSFHSGLDVVVEGKAVRITDAGRLSRLAQLWRSKYEWEFEVAGDALIEPGSTGEDPALVFAVAPSKVLAFGKGEPFSQTRYQFSRR